MAGICNELNNIPQCLGSRYAGLDELDLLTANRLMLGRNNERSLAGPCKLGGRSKMEEEQNKLFKVWWQTWLNERVVEYVPQPSGWKYNNENVKEGDIVLLPKDAQKGAVPPSKWEPFWRVGRIQSISGSTDGLARRAVVEYKNPGEKVFRNTDRAVRSLAVIHHEGELEMMQEINRAARTADRLLLVRKIREDRALFLMREFRKRTSYALCVRMAGGPEKKPPVEKVE